MARIAARMSCYSMQSKEVLSQINGQEIPADSTSGDVVKENDLGNGNEQMMGSRKRHHGEENKTVQNKERFRYGNYNRYYGTRMTDKFQRDPRLDLFPLHWFQGKAILDVGCNVGFLTLSIAKDFSPNRIVGIDIDGNLIGIARKNIRHYCEKGVELIGKFPASLASDSRARATNLIDRTFPKNVWFRKDNYVLESDDLLDMVREEYHVILALSITKWIHLNWGDGGIRRFFKRIFKHLCFGGRLILEPQDFSTYSKRSKMAADMQRNYKEICFKPEQFTEYLLSSEVGFEKVEELGIPKANSKGFERPLLVFTKPGLRRRKKDSE